MDQRTQDAIQENWRQFLTRYMPTSREQANRFAELFAEGLRNYFNGPVEVRILDLRAEYSAFGRGTYELMAEVYVVGSGYVRLVGRYDGNAAAAAREYRDYPRRDRQFGGGDWFRPMDFAFAEKSCAASGCTNKPLLVGLGPYCDSCATKLGAVNRLIAILTKISEAVAFRAAFIGSFGAPVTVRPIYGGPRWAAWCGVHGPQLRPGAIGSCQPCDRCAALAENRRAAIEKLVGILLLCGHAMWEGIDDTAKRVMMLDMDPASGVVEEAPVEPLPIDLREVPIPVKPWTPPKPYVPRVRPVEAPVYVSEERMELLELYEVPHD